MKTRINQIAGIVLFAVIFLAGNVKAEGTERTASSHEIIEETLVIENWMINESYWETETTFIIENTSDETLEVENWMTSENNWETAEAISVEQETETNLEVENWMINENNWNN